MHVSDQVVLTLLGMVGSMVIAAVGMTWFLSKQFTLSRREFWEAITALQRQIEIKIDNHEKHDEERFERVRRRLHQLGNQIWRIHVRNAAKDGVEVADRQTFEEMDKEDPF